MEIPNNTSASYFFHVHVDYQMDTPSVTCFVVPSFIAVAAPSALRLFDLFEH